MSPLNAKVLDCVSFRFRLPTLTLADSLVSIASDSFTRRSTIDAIFAVIATARSLKEKSRVSRVKVELN